MNLTISTQDFTGKKLSDVQKKVKNPAGLKELEYVLAHPDEFPEMKDDNYYFFFGAAVGEHVPYLRWNGDRFYRNSRWLEYGWGSHDRAVLRDSELALEMFPGTNVQLDNLILDLEKLVRKYKK